jgi:hypothetical protein
MPCAYALILGEILSYAKSDVYAESISWQIFERNVPANSGKPSQLRDMSGPQHQPESFRKPAVEYNNRFSMIPP